MTSHEKPKAPTLTKAQLADARAEIPPHLRTGPYEYLAEAPEKAEPSTEPEPVDAVKLTAHETDEDGDPIVMPKGRRK